MSDNLSDPLVPVDVDLTDFPYFQLDVRRLRDSRLAASVSGEEFRCAVLLWCAAWHQIPAASLPDDDIELAQLAGFGRAINEWRKYREGALYGFVRCADGRFYHPTIAEKACDAWNEKQAHRYRRECDRTRKENIRRKEKGLPDLKFPPEPIIVSVGTVVSFQRNSASVPTEKENIPPETQMGIAGIPPENALKGEGRESKGRGKGKGKGEGLKKPTPKTVAPRSASGPSAPPKTALLWTAYATAYRQRYGVEPVRNASVNSKLAQFIDRIGAAEAPQVAAFYLRHNGQFYVRGKHSVGAMLQDAEGLRTEWARGQTVTDTEARQADQTQARGNVWGKILEEARESNDE